MMDKKRDKGKRAGEGLDSKGSDIWLHRDVLEQDEKEMKKSGKTIKLKSTINKDQEVEEESYVFLNTILGAEPLTNEGTVLIDGEKTLMPSMIFKRRESNIKNEAIFSKDEKYRYSLTKIWDEGKPKAVFIGINPSDATEIIMDKTVMNLMNHLITNNYGSVEIVNLFAYRSKNQDNLKYGSEEQEKFNLEFVKNALKDASIIIVGWGRGAEKKAKYTYIINKVKEELKKHERKTKCFQDTKGNINCHLSIGYSEDWKLVEYKLRH